MTKWNGYEVSTDLVLRWERSDPRRTGSALLPTQSRHHSGMASPCSGLRRNDAVEDMAVERLFGVDADLYGNRR